MADKLSHIPIEEMRQDILDTEREIEKMTREEQGFRLVGDRWSVMRADGRIEGIKKRREFISKVQKLIDERNEKI